MLEKVKQTIEKYNMLKNGDKIVLGVSGGSDSVCLFDIFIKVLNEYDITLYVAHVNHCIRGNEAIRDEEYVKKLADSNNIKCFIKRVDVKEYAKIEKITLEEAGRKARYDFFEEISKQVGADKIAVAHNLNDKAETFLFNLMRGTGMQGLKSIEPVRANIIRPLIEIQKSEIENYCKDNNLEYLVDKTNFENDYTRNKIRNMLIPYIKDNFNSNILSAISRTTEILSMENKYLEKITEECLKKCMIKDFVLNIDTFNSFDNVIKARMLRLIIEKLNGTAKNIEKNHIEKIIKLAQNKKTNTKIKLPEEVFVEVIYEELVFTNKPKKQAIDYSFNLKLGVNYIENLGCELVLKLDEFEKVDIKNKNLCVLDYDKITNNIDKLVLRNRRIGDVFSPIGMKGTKKLKDYFIDNKIPVQERDKALLLAIDNEIIWIIGDRVSEKFIRTNKKGEVLVCEYRK